MRISANIFLFLLLLRAYARNTLRSMEKFKFNLNENKFETNNRNCYCKKFFKKELSGKNFLFSNYPVLLKLEFNLLNSKKFLPLVVSTQ